jgi:serine protease
VNHYFTSRQIGLSVQRFIAVFCIALSAVDASAGGPDALAGVLHTSNSTITTIADSTDRIIVRYFTRRHERSRMTEDSRKFSSALIQEISNRRGFIAKHVRTNALGAQIWSIDRAISKEEALEFTSQIASSDSNVEYAEPDLRMQPLLTPNDPSYLSQWHYYETTAGINLPGAWDKSNGSSIVVAVIDTGYRPHVDLAGNIATGYDFIKDSSVANDGGGRDSSALDPGDAVVQNECGTGTPSRTSSWHGTHVSGTIAAVTNNSLGVAGAAYGAKVQPLRVLGKCGGYTSDVADAIVYASGYPLSSSFVNPVQARVINLSLGGSGACGSTYLRAINIARARGTVVVVAAGNSGIDVSGTAPANCPGVISVAALNRNGSRASFSNYGSSIAVAAPGSSVLSTLNTGTTTPGADSYGYYSGTSMASPHVAGTAALMLSKRPTLSPDEVRQILRSTSRAFPLSCSGCGAGITNAASAVTTAIGTPAKGNSTATLSGPSEIWFWDGTSQITVAVGGNNPTGTVSFYTNGLAVATVSLSNGIASIPAANLAGTVDNVGYDIFAVYNGDTRNFMKMSNTRTLTVMRD